MKIIQEGVAGEKGKAAIVWLHRNSGIPRIDENGFIRFRHKSRYGD